MSNEKFDYIHVEDVGSGQFCIAKLPNNTLLFIFKDKHGIFNVFPTMNDYTLYAKGWLYGLKRECIDDEYIEEGEEGYEEGVDALDRYLRTMSEPIGAYCDIRYLDDGSEGNKYYFSFVGLSGEDDEKDAAGIPNNEIFFFADMGEKELKDWNAQPNRDFDIAAYTLRYREVDASDGGAG